jgi:hypothetical protein
MRMLRNLIGKLLFGLVVIPPAYLIYRFISWSMRQDYGDDSDLGGSISS